MPNASEKQDTRRFACVHGPCNPETVRAYMPANYHVTVLRPGYANQTILISGEDRAGWTLDGYVIPRLASGLIFAAEKDSVEEVRARIVPGR